MLILSNSYGQKIVKSWNRELCEKDQLKIILQRSVSFQTKPKIDKISDLMSFVNPSNMHFKRFNWFIMAKWKINGVFL